MPKMLCSAVVRVLLLAVIVLSPLFVPDRSSAGNEPFVYGGVGSFTWREFGDTGQVLKESGPLYGVGFTNLHEFDNHLTLKPRIEIFGGSVDYNGQACDVLGNCLPADTTTHYFGTKLEMDMGFRAGRPDAFTIEPFLGLGFRFWYRSIDDSYLADGSYAVGYTEDWSTVYGRAGLRAQQHLSPKNLLFAEVGVKLPIDTTNYINDENVSYSSITLHPVGEPSLFAEAGVKLNMFQISAFYDSMRFKQSDTVYQYDPYYGALIGYWQPKSESETIGIRAGVAFY
jgi:hypothetical protein